MGYSNDIMRVGDPEAIWPQFGWSVSTVDGHDVNELSKLVRQETSMPHLIVARTVAGKGVSFMERKVEWHYWPMSDSQFEQAMNEVNGLE
jgi:transketolase